VKSLAHPDWPYAGTAHEWRGFAKEAEMPKVQPSFHAVDRPASEFFEMVYGSPEEPTAIYQKQKFGPDLK
jgi:hypothetical protein